MMLLLDKSWAHDMKNYKFLGILWISTIASSIFGRMEKAFMVFFPKWWRWLDNDKRRAKALGLSGKGWTFVLFLSSLHVPYLTPSNTFLSYNEKSMEELSLKETMPLIIFCHLVAWDLESWVVFRIKCNVVSVKEYCLESHIV